MVGLHLHGKAVEVMGSVECFLRLKQAGLTTKEVGILLRLSSRQLERLEHGVPLLPLDERHAMAHYMSFARNAKRFMAAENKRAVQ
jgi:hypothetical protein